MQQAEQPRRDLITVDGVRVLQVGGGAEIEMNLGEPTLGVHEAEQRYE
jgi:hypothetical protein